MLLRPFLCKSKRGCAHLTHPLPIHVGITTDCKTIRDYNCSSVVASGFIGENEELPGVPLAQIID